MAGGKETPRQKMIGMMYLVLTALLALQVNSAILLKFKFIDDSLIDVNGKTAKAADDTIEGIKAAVLKNRNTAKDQAVLKESEEIRAKTTEIVTYLREVRDKLVVAGENAKGSTEYKDPSAEDKVAALMLGEKKGVAYKLKPKLNEYAAYIKKYVPGATALALDGKEDERITKAKDQHTKEQKSKDFAELNFENTPLVAALAILSQKETEVLKYQADALTAQAQKVGAQTIVFDKLAAFAAAESNTVAAGTKYKAQLFLTASATGLKQVMTYNGSSLSVDPVTSHGKVEFTARPGNFDKDGNAKANWTGTIRVNQNGRDTTFKVLVPYTITQPVIQVMSDAVQALYLKCGNALNVQVPALGSEYKPSFTASGASVISGQQGKVTLVPNGREVTLNVSSGGNAIGKQIFKVRPIPNPTIRCLVGGIDIESPQARTGVPPRALVQGLSMKAIPEAGFASFLPKDARYRVSRFKVQMARGRRPVGGELSGTSSADLSALAGQARGGDRLVVTLEGVQRLNFQDQVEDVPMSRVFIVPITE